MNKPRMMDPKMMVAGLEKYFKDDSIVMQFIPIILVLIYVSYKTWFVDASHTILGKVVAILLILYYTSIDYVYGTLCCVVIIAFYQMHEREGFGTEGTAEVEEGTSLDDGIPSMEAKPVGDAKPKEGGVMPSAVPSAKSFNAGSQLSVKPNTIDAFTTARDTFIQEKCKNGVLMYKDFPVKSEMADHIFPEIQFNTKSRCNPCDTTCDYSIVEAKIDTETELCPRSSNNLFDQVKDIFYPKRCDKKGPEPTKSPIPNK
jgi:hypothetical protein